MKLNTNEYIQYLYAVLGAPVDLDDAETQAAALLMVAAAHLFMLDTARSPSEHQADVRRLAAAANDAIHTQLRLAPTKAEGN